MLRKIVASDFVKRQTKYSRFSYTSLSWERLEELVINNFYLAKTGYREGVLLVPMEPENFFSAVAKRTNDMTIEKGFEARREGEAPVPFSYTVGTKPPAKFVEVVIYRKDVLEEDIENRVTLTGADWEIVSINCRLTEEEYPIPPATMARNQLALKGGTKADYTGDQFAKSIVFWGGHVLIKENEV